MPRPTLQLEFEPLTADDLELLASRQRATGRGVAYLEARSIVRIGRLQRWLNGDYYEGDKLIVDGGLGPSTFWRLQVAVGIGAIYLDGETRWYVELYTANQAVPPA